MECRKNIGELLVEYRKISGDDLAEALRLQKDFGLRLGETLIRLGKVRAEDIEWILSKQLNIPFVIVEDVPVENRLLRKFPEEFLVRNSILPLYETEENIAIATDDPLNEEAFGLIEKTTGKNIMLSSGNGEKITSVLKKYFRTQALPRLGRELEQLTERLKGTCFYRIDFILGEHDCSICIFGCGIRRQVSYMMNPLKKEDVFEALESLDIRFLYDEYANENTVLLSVYPLFDNPKHLHYPAVIGIFGLCIPDSITFTDSHGRNLPGVLHSAIPVNGYPFFATKNTSFMPEQAIFTPDSIHASIKKYSVCAVIPELCLRCQGAGCISCNQLGHAFLETVEGTYTAGEIRQFLLRE